MTGRARIGFAVLMTSALAVLAGDWASSQAQTPQAGAPPAARGRTLRLPDPPYRYTDVALPRHFTAAAAMRFDNTPPENPLTDHGATLGRVLFYDTRLSANNTVSCGSCHAQARAFDDPERFSRGFKGGRTDRHAMNLVNLRYHPRGRFFWDERGGNLEDMVLLPVQNTLEMGQEVAQLPAILSREPHYPPLFSAAFGDADMTETRIARALAQFVRSLVSYQSRYDEGLAQRCRRRRRLCQLLAAGEPGQGAVPAQLRDLPPAESAGRALRDDRARQHRAGRGRDEHRRRRRRRHAQPARPRAVQVAVAAQRGGDRALHARRPAGRRWRR